MPKVKGDLQKTATGQTVGKQQLYAILVDANHAPVLDAAGNTQVIEAVADAQGRIEMLATLSGSLALDDGTKTSTTPGTSVPLVATSTPCRSVIVVAKPDNTGTVKIGGATPLIPYAAGKGVSLSVSDLNMVYIDPSVSGEGVFFTWEV